MAKENVKTSVEIGSLVKRLTPNNQAYVMNTINALLYSQQINKNKVQKSEY